MAGLLNVDVDAEALIAALERLPREVAQRHVNLRSEETAQNIAREAQARVRRKTGETAQGIRVEAARNGNGYVVLAERQQFPNLPLWIEAGTVHQPPRPFFRPSAILEEGPHRRRIEEAIQASIDEVGLGA